MTGPQGTTEAERRAVLDAVQADEGASHVKVAVSDLDGILRGKYLDRNKLTSVLDDGFGFCDVIFGWDSADECYEGVDYTSWKTGYPDGLSRIDVGTHRQIPWEGGRHLFLADYVGSSETTRVCPRLLLKDVIDRASSMGYQGFFGMEFEWFNFRETPQSAHDKGYRDLTPLTPGMFGYSVLRQTTSQDLFDAMLRELPAFGVPIEGLHCETGPGVLEAAIVYSDALEAADRAVLFKAGTKEIAHRFGIMPSFMARPFTDLPGCSGHTHQSLWDLDAEQNLFFDADDPAKMSDTYRSYLAGILQLLPEMLVLLAPTVNSYKRLVDGFWAPTKPTWAVDNRTVACRVIPGSPKSTRLEVRVPGSDANPYLAVAATYAAGLWGVERGLELTQPATVGSGYHDESAERLPRDLIDATRRFGDSATMRELLGDGFVDHVAATREWEWRQYLDSVSDWERERYFEII